MKMNLTISSVHTADIRIDMIKHVTKWLCDCCGEEMPPIQSLDDLVPKSATKEWSTQGLDNEFLKLKLALSTSLNLKENTYERN